MRVPFVAIAAAFASGIALGLHPTLVRNASHIMLSSFFIFIGVLVLVGIILVRIGRLFAASVASLLSWVLLGILGLCIAQQPRGADHCSRSWSKVVSPCTRPSHAAPPFPPSQRASLAPLDT